jgi:hypothetical protein
MTPDTASIAHAVAEALRDNPALIEQFSSLGLPADLLREIAAQPTPSPAPPFSDQAVAVYARMTDGSCFFAIVDPEPPEAA